MNSHCDLILQRIETLKSKLDDKKRKDSKIEEKIEDCVDNKITYEKEISEQDEVQKVIFCLNF